MVPKLQEEIKQGKPFRSLQEEVFINILLTADTLSRKLSETLKRSGLTPAQYNVLRILRGAGECGHACREIGDRMITKDPDITRLLDRLEDRGLVSRARDERDRRVITVRVTRRGLELLSELDSEVDRFDLKLFEHMSERQLTKLCELLELARERAV
jgi:DNA-binding MarR family transcriptional regulator